MARYPLPDKQGPEAPGTDLGGVARLGPHTSCKGGVRGEPPTGRGVTSAFQDSHFSVGRSW